MEKLEISGNILDKINTKLLELGSSAKWKRLPEYREEYESLRGKRVVLVDDLARILETFIPDLMVATEGNAGFVKYDQQAVKEVVDQILKQNPDIVLLDFNLSHELKGDAVCRMLQDENFQGKIIGFSSDRYSDREFEKAGVTAIVPKATHKPSQSVLDVAEAVKENK